MPRVIDIADRFLLIFLYERFKMSCIFCFELLKTSLGSAKCHCFSVFIIYFCDLIRKIKTKDISVSPTNDSNLKNESPKVSWILNNCKLG